MIKKSYILLFFSIASIFCVAETALAQSQLAFANKNYIDQVQSVLLYPADEPLMEPVIMLDDQTEKLQLSFDVLGDFAYTYNYTVIHCSYDWKPSDLKKIEYIEGFEENQIRDYRFSVNTLTPYVHYDQFFPNADMRLKLSGNYLLVVYDGDFDEGNFLLSRRFMLVDPKASIEAQVPQYPKNLSYTKTHQQVDVTVNAESVFMVSPLQSVQLVIRQNGRWDNAVMGLKPNYTYSDKLVYEYEEETVFDGGNQFRNFDMKSFRYQSERIERIFQEPEYFTVRLWPDKRRIFDDYITEPDIFGRKLIKARDDQDTDTEGDYAWVEFFLSADAPYTHEDVYIIGALNDWNLDNTNKMTYNYKRKGYQASLFLKQGYYNYLYGLVERGQKSADVSLIEGNHWETLNEYSIYVYYKKPGTNYDQLIASAVILSHP